ncbi:MAG: cation diffusion facilitator family transporter [Terriglobia bacterium]|nr:cation diffusion facilitator family transporter [Terriglobia bacterium]
MDASFNAEAMRAEKRGVAARSVYAALLITGLKFIVGFTTGSLGILSEALHSSLDLIAAVVTLLSVRVSDKPADADHQYGHGKVENFSAFIETGLLLLTCIWIVWEAFKRLFFHSVEIEPSVWAFVVMFISIGVDAWRSRALKRVADRYDSQALQADALHFSTDIWSSSVVILGLAVVWGGREYNLPWLQKADPVAALFVACVVVYVSWRLARQTIDALLDAAPAGVRNNIINAVEAVPGVLEVDRVRIRRAGNRYFADLSVGLARTATFQRSEQIVAEVTQKIRSILKDVDVLVNAVPRALHTENIFDRIRAAALKHNLMVHDVSVQDLGGQLHVEQHVELDEKLSLLEAHDHVTALEADIRESVPEISSILTHIESEPATIETSDEIVQDRTLERSLKDIVAGFPDVVDVHEIILKRVREHLFLSCHVTMQDELPLSRVHDIQTALEIRFKQAAPQLFRVLIHPEPQTDNRR